MLLFVLFFCGIGIDVDSFRCGSLRVWSDFVVVVVVVVVVVRFVSFERW